MQRQYHARAARKKRALLRWKWDVEKARMENRQNNLQATRLQSWWRGLRAKWLALRLLQITVEVLWDPGISQAYHFNHSLGQATWDVPSMLRRWRGEDARMPSVPEWIFISRIFGQVREEEDGRVSFVVCRACGCRACFFLGGGSVFSRTGACGWWVVKDRSSVNDKGKGGKCRLGLEKKAVLQNNCFSKDLFWESHL